MDLGLKDKVVVITGGARGIGKAIADSFIKEGAKVITTDINGEGALFYKMDVSNTSEVELVFKKIIEDHKKIDILINNAGITKDTLLMRMKEEDWDKVLDVNLKGVFNCTKAASQSMIKERSGRIINISSIVGVMGNVGQANYSASKAGMIGFTKTVARELAARNITVNAIAPGFIVSDMTEKLTEEVKNDFMSKIPLRRFGGIEEIADLVLFLSSNRASYITGQVVGINGGMLM
jgi:3-oxoacyl-[acyl-carrier protein] reductase